MGHMGAGQEGTGQRGGDHHPEKSGREEFRKGVCACEAEWVSNGGGLRADTLP